MPRQILGLLLLSVIALNVDTGRAQTCDDYTRYSHVATVTPKIAGASVGGLALNGSLLVAVGENGYPNLGAWLWTFDISDPVNPALVGSLPAQPQEFVGSWDVELSGNYAFATSSTSLYVVAIFDPAYPVQLTNFPMPGTPGGLAIAGNIAYVACGDAGLVAVDIATPGAPSIVGTLPLSGSASNVVTNGNIAAVVTLGLGGSQLAFADVSDPAQMSPGFSVFGYQPYPLDMRGNLVLGVNGQNGQYLRIIDASDHIAPVNISVWSVSKTIFAAAFDGDAVLVNTPNQEFIVDITDPVHPVTAMSTNLKGGSQEGIESTPGFAFSVNAKTIQVMAKKDNGDLTQPPTSTLNPGGIINDVLNGMRVRGDRLFVGHVPNVFRVYDVSNPLAPASLGSRTLPTGTIAVDGNNAYAYVARSDRLNILDLNTPGFLATASLPIGYYPSDIRVDGNTVYVLGSVADGPTYDLVFGIYDVSAPTALSNIGGFSWAAGGTFFDERLEIHNGFAYVGWRDGVEVIDATLPPEAARVTTLPLPQATSVHAAGNYLFVTYDQRFAAVDISNPSSPVIVDDLGLSGLSFDFAIDGNLDFAYVGTVEKYVNVIDISTPSALRTLGVFFEEEDFLYSAVKDGSIIAGKDAIYTYPVQCAVTTAVERPVVPGARLALKTYPNPFNPNVTIQLKVATSGPVSVTIVDVAGRRVATLAERAFPAGEHEVRWDGRNDNRAAVASGVYWVRAAMGNEVQTAKVTLLK